MVQRGIAWRGVAWHGMMWHGLVQLSSVQWGVAWRGVVWCDVLGVLSAVRRVACDVVYGTIDLT